MLGGHCICQMVSLWHIVKHVMVTNFQNIGAWGCGDADKERLGMLVVLLRGMVSLRVFITKHHYFYFSKCLLGCTRRSNESNGITSV